MTISLHSLSPTTMEDLTGVPGCLERIFTALCDYSEVFPQGKYVGGINTVVTRANLEEIPRLIRFASVLGLTIALIPVHFPVCDNSGRRSGDGQLSFGSADAPALHRIFAEARSLKRQGHRVYNTDRFLTECVDFMSHDRVSWKCLSPSLYFSVDASGTMLPCVDLGGRHSLIEEGFLESWQSGAIPRELRAQVSACRGCMYPCYPEFSYLFHSKRMFVGRVFDYVKISAPAPPLTMGRIRRVMEQLG
jgi:MoaA/NifB/PqqE/SkfB family radical SAM enzyme